MERRWMLAVCVGLLGACQIETPSSTGEVQQSSLEACTTQANFCDATMSPKPWDGKSKPQVLPGQRYVGWEHKPGEYLVMLADVENKQIVWAVTTPSTTIGSLLGILAGTDTSIDIGRPPPPPPPPDGTDVIRNARIGLETAKLLDDVPATASYNAGGCPPPPPPVLK